MKKFRTYIEKWLNGKKVRGVNVSLYDIQECIRVYNAFLTKENTGFINIVLPYFEGGKDISDLYKIKGKKQFVEIMKNLFIQNSTYDDLPF